MQEKKINRAPPEEKKRQIITHTYIHTSVTAFAATKLHLRGQNKRKKKNENENPNEQAIVITPHLCFLKTNVKCKIDQRFLPTTPLSGKNDSNQLFFFPQEGRFLTSCAQLHPLCLCLKTLSMQQ
jgi:hypothetical protein